jgi:catechol 2,3-dioxygenase-like lactoylglutathione lyase family enzyme
MWLTVTQARAGDQTPRRAARLPVMGDRAVPTLPSRSIAATSAFYQTLGFREEYRDEGWLIMSRGALTLEFFPHPDLDPSTSDHQANLRLDDLDSLHRDIATVLEQSTAGIPRLTPVERQPWGARAAFLIDLDGTMLRLIEN